MFFDGTFWSSDELIPLGLGDEARRGDGPPARWAGRAAAWPRCATCAPRTASRPPQQHEPAPARGFARARGGRRRRLGGRVGRHELELRELERDRTPRMTSRAARREEFIDRLREEGAAPLPRPPPLPRRDARRQARRGPAPAVGAEPLLLPDAHPDQGRAHPRRSPRTRRSVACGSGASTITTASRRARAGSRCGCGWPRAWGSTARRSRAAARCCRACASPATATWSSCASGAWSRRSPRR